MKHVVIDTNIYLNFYKLKGDQPIRMLKELTTLINTEDFELILPDQIRDEFVRNKYSNAVYKDQILNLEEQLNVNFVSPPILQNSRYEQKVSNAVNKLRKYKKEIVDEYKSRVFNENSKLNKGLTKLFSLATKVTHDNALLQTAYFRTIRNNPPRKDNRSFGDAVIWESILKDFTEQDLVLISGDGDFESDMKKGSLNEFLQSEWKNITDRELTFYTNLGSFINDQSPEEKPISEEEIQNEEEELDSVYLTTPNITYSDLLNNSVSAAPFMGTFDSLSSAHGKCICCGAHLETSLANWNATGKCQNCEGHLSKGQTCNRCGRHFHPNTWSTLVSQNGTCEQCQ